jgi:hypothetical protein
MSDIAVYSTYCGSTNNKTLFERHADPRYPHFFVSNNEEILELVSSLGWNPIQLHEPVYDDIRISSKQAKIAKIIPHTLPFIKDFEYTLYIDDKIGFNTDIIEDNIDALIENDSPMSLRKHQYLSPNVFVEIGESMVQQRYYEQLDQMAKYAVDQVKRGYSVDHNVLYTTSAIFRNMRHKLVDDINDLWYQHMLRCGIECQTSFFFIAQRYPSIRRIIG